jgi:ribulose-5-phosphate 4-epimerase/fuculose-1-phosphate aldolase
MAVCCLEEGLSFTNFYAAHLWGQVAYHDFEGITVHAEEGARILASARVNAGPIPSSSDPLGGHGGQHSYKPVLLLRNHGPVVMGSTVAQAFAYMWVLQRACEVQLASQGKGALRPIPVPVLEACVRDALNFDPRYGAGEDGFAALQRLVDAKDPSYRA